MKKYSKPLGMIAPAKTATIRFPKKANRESKNADKMIVTMQVIRYALESVADEMGHTLVRTGRSTIITEIKDISCVVCDAKGQTVAQAHHTPSLLAGFEITMRELV